MSTERRSGTTTRRRRIADEEIREAIDHSFLSAVFHDLKAPLATILGAMELLALQKKTMTGDQCELIDLAANGGQRLNELLNDAHLLASLESGKIQPRIESSRIRGILQEVVESVAIPKTIPLTLACPETLEAPVDRDLFAQAMTQLLTNAVKYSPRGGAVAVKAGNDAQHFVVSVEDHGVGIPPQETGAIFGRFHRAERVETQEIEGTGLGLAVVKMIVEKHGGTIEVRSAIGSGSCFTVKLPIKS